MGGGERKVLDATGWPTRGDFPGDLQNIPRSSSSTEEEEETVKCSGVGIKRLLYGPLEPKKVTNLLRQLLCQLHARDVVNNEVLGRDNFRGTRLARVATRSAPRGGISLHWVRYS